MGVSAAQNCRLLAVSMQMPIGCQDSTLWFRKRRSFLDLIWPGCNVQCDTCIPAPLY